jgi:hypothetical protein
MWAGSVILMDQSKNPVQLTGNYSGSTISTGSNGLYGEKSQVKLSSYKLLDLVFCRKLQGQVICMRKCQVEFLSKNCLTFFYM